jgi:GNAT superfamily N-acetyltransferase
MTMKPTWDSKIRKLLNDDLTSVREHLLRLDQESLYLRFGNTVTDAFLIQYVERMPDLDTVVFACCVDGAVRGVGELRRLGVGRDHEAEAAFTVERSFADLGMGTALMAAVINEARDIGVQDIFMCFELFNRRMRRITEKFQGLVSYDGRDCIGRVSIEAASRSGVRGLKAALMLPIGMTAIPALRPAQSE